MLNFTDSLPACEHLGFLRGMLKQKSEEFATVLCIFVKRIPVSAFQSPGRSLVSSASNGNADVVSGPCLQLPFNPLILIVLYKVFDIISFPFTVVTSSSMVKVLKSTFV